MNPMHQGGRFEVHHHFLHTLFRSILEIHRPCEDPPETTRRATFPGAHLVTVKGNTEGRTYLCCLPNITQYSTVCVISGFQNFVIHLRFSPKHADWLRKSI